MCMLASRDVQESNHKNSAHGLASGVLLVIEHGMYSEKEKE